MTALKKWSDYNALTASALRGSETVLLADTGSTGMVTATTISATASTNTIADSGSGLPIIKVGGFVKVSGFTDSAAELNGLHTVVSSSSSSLVIATDITTDEAAGASVTVSEVAAMYQVTLDDIAAYTAASGSSKALISEYTAAHTIALTDIGNVVSMNSSSATIVTIPNTSTVDIDVLETLAVRRMGSGSVTFAAASGVTIYPTGTVTISAQYATASLHHIAENVWVIDGYIGVA